MINLIGSYIILYANISIYDCFYSRPGVTTLSYKAVEVIETLV
jgi:hypothetical protein